jgi:RES domain-containing protein
MLVNNQFKDFSIDLSLLRISIPDTIEIKEIKLNKLKAKWNEDASYSKFIGNEFIKSMNSLVLKVPSAVVTEEHNYLINPLHADFKKIKITDTKKFSTDERLFTI